jgi:hypothetical protein
MGEFVTTDYTCRLPGCIHYSAKHTDHSFEEFYCSPLCCASYSEKTYGPQKTMQLEIPCYSYTKHEIVGAAKLEPESSLDKNTMEE